MLRLLFSLALFLSASLLFVIQPMVAKSMLPVYGGTPAVWTMCMLFFQVLLLLGYAYAWMLSRMNAMQWRWVHFGLVVVIVFFLPLHFSVSQTGAIPDIAILQVLLRQLTIPLLIIVSSAPLLQYAYSQTQALRAHDPYFLYTASNAGSLIALLSYPVVIERFLPVQQQYFYWNVLFGFYLLLLLLILFAINYQQVEKTAATPNSTIDWRHCFQWIFYAFIPCSLMLGVTFYISTDIAATPLFWVLPLALYLISFIITFARKPLITHQWVVNNTLFFLIFPLLAFIFGANQLSAWQLISFHLVSFFILALLCHGELIKMRPPTDQLTLFYFCLALGGVIAGIFNGLIAPHWFNAAYEYPLTLALACLCIPQALRQPLRMTFLLLPLCLLLDYQVTLPWIKNNHVFLVSYLIVLIWLAKSRLTLFVGIMLLLIYHFVPFSKTNTLLMQNRNFFGVKQVVARGNTHVLISQNTVHGFQFNQQTLNGNLAYYNPVFTVTRYLQKEKPSLKTVILGLGTGLLNCQFRLTDKVILVDIDPQVIDIANNPDYFTYLKECKTQLTIEQGDARLVMQQQPAHYFDLLILDAFSSDAIPTHLLTQEAFKIYQQKIQQGGTIMVNMSNRYLNILPVLRANGQMLNQTVLHKFDPGNNKKGQFPTEWVLLTSNQSLADWMIKQQGWVLMNQGQSIVWTDDYSNVLPLIKW